MKKPLHILLISLALTALCTLATAAETPIKLVTADLAHLYENYYRTAEAEARFQSAVESAKTNAQAMVDEGNALVEEYRKLVEEAQSPALSAEARAAAEAAAEEQARIIREKEMEVQQFQANTQRALQERQRTHRQLMLDEIKVVVNEIAKERGATLVLDSSPNSSVIFADPSFDITEEALEELNKDKPAEE